jgi:predicted nucleic acid-binding protein
LIPPKIVVDTHLFIEHLCGTSKPSILRLALRKFFCYTTVFQAAELFSLAQNEKEHLAMEHALACVKILGVNARSAMGYGRLVRNRRGKDMLCTLAAGLCIESKLPLLTDRIKDFARIPGLVCIPTSLVAGKESGREILSIAGGPGRKGT